MPYLYEPGDDYTPPAAPPPPATVPPLDSAGSILRPGDIPAGSTESSAGGGTVTTDAPGTGGGGGGSTRTLADAFVTENSQAVETADVKLPAGAFADLRDTLVHDLPYVGTHVRNRGRGMKAVVASDLWPHSA